MQQEGTERYFLIKQDGFQIRIIFTAIQYVEAEGKFLRIFTSTQEYITRFPISKFLQHANEDSIIFCRVHKSYVAQIAAIRMFNNSVVVLNKKNIPIGRQFKKGLILQLKVGASNIKKEPKATVAQLYALPATIPFALQRMDQSGD